MGSEQHQQQGAPSASKSIVWDARFITSGHPHAIPGPQLDSSGLLPACSVATSGKLWTITIQ